MAAIAMLMVTASGLHAQTPAASNFTILLRGVPIGSEQVSVEQTAQGWTVSSSGRIGPPLDLVLRTLRLRYDAEWKPLELTVDATARDQASVLHTTVTGTTATSEITPVNATPASTTAEIDARALLLPNPFVAPYEALAARLRTEAAGATIPIYQPRGPSFSALVGESTAQQIQTLNGLVQARRTTLTFQAAGAPSVSLEVWGDEHGRLLRVSIPAQNTDFVREDLASVSSRIVTMARPNDEDVRIPANGFSLAGTVSRPAAASGPLPAVVLIAGSGPTDRDETVFGIPIFGQIADALADAGFLVLRYDKRGVGQSGGRAEAATLTDFAEDAKAAVTFLSSRKDVDRKRVAVVGHSEGGWIAMLTAAKNNRVAAAGLISTVGVTGRELNLYQVTHATERSTRPAAERQHTIELQTQIQDAVISGNGWDKIDAPPAVRRQAETPYFQSFLLLDPAKVMKDVKQPLLIVQGELDTQVPPSNADRLETLGKTRKNAPVEVVKIPGINHLLVPANTGEVDEYGTLPDRHVSPAVTTALITWLQKTMPPGR
jgi:pimeloyl-ACP methyl ester carboxylesterase